MVRDASERREYDTAVAGIVRDLAKRPAYAEERAASAGIRFDRRDGAWPAGWFLRLEPSTPLRVSGFAAVWFTLAYLRSHDFRPFAVYRFILGAAIIFVVVAGLRQAGGI